MSIDTNAIRIQIDELRATITELRQDLADAEREVDRLTADNKGLITCLKKDVTYKQAVELAKREHEITKLTADNKELTMLVDRNLESFNIVANDNAHLTADNKQYFHEMANYKQERDTARADLYLAEQRECVLEENNKVMREVLKKIAKSGQDPFSRKWARDALTTIKGDPK